MYTHFNVTHILPRKNKHLMLFYVNLEMNIFRGEYFWFDYINYQNIQENIFSSLSLYNTVCSKKPYRILFLYLSPCLETTYNLDKLQMGYQIALCGQMSEPVSQQTKVQRNHKTIQREGGDTNKYLAPPYIQNDLPYLNILVSIILA